MSPSYFPIVGGAEIHVGYLASALRTRSIDCEVVTFCDTKKWEPSKRYKQKVLDGTRVSVWPSFSVGKPSHLTNVHYVSSTPFGLRDYMNKADILHFHDDIDLSFPFSLQRVNKPRIFSCHSLCYTWTFYAKQPLARKLFTGSADLFQVFSRRDAANLKTLGVVEDRIRIIPILMPTIVQSRVSEDRPKVSRDTVRIVWVGRIERSKGLIVLLKAANLLKNNFRNFELLIGGKVWDAGYYRELLDYKAAANLGEAHFTGFVGDLQSFLLDADIFASPSLKEVGPMTVLEAMGYGLPVVGSDVGAVPDFIVDNETGFVVPPGDPVAMATKLQLLVSDKKLRIRMGRKATERITSHFSYNRIFSMILDMYRELI